MLPQRYGGLREGNFIKPEEKEGSRRETGDVGWGERNFGQKEEQAQKTARLEGKNLHVLGSARR